MHKKLFIFLSLLALLATACAGATGSPAPSERRILRVMTHDSFAASEEVIANFEEANNAEIQFLASGDTGTALNKAILAKDNPLADVFYGVDNTFLSRAVSEEIFIPYTSPLLADVPDSFELDPTHHALPVDYGDVCLNYDKAYFADHGLTPPASLEDLLQPAYKDLLVVENPATSSPGLAFLLATIGRFGEESYLDFWQGLVDNGLKVVNDWETAYNSEFSVHGGTRPLVVSYGSSPPAEVIFAASPIDEAPTGVVTQSDSCFRQIEFAGILAGTQNQDLAKKWIDYMLSPTFQEDMPLQMFVFPVNQNAQLPAEFKQHTVIPATTSVVTPDEISAGREAWLQAWTAAVLR